MNNPVLGWVRWRKRTGCHKRKQQEIAGSLSEAETWRIKRNFPREKYRTGEQPVQRPWGRHAWEAGEVASIEAEEEGRDSLKSSGSHWVLKAEGWCDAVRERSLWLLGGEQIWSRPSLESDRWSGRLWQESRQPIMVLGLRWQAWSRTEVGGFQKYSGGSVGLTGDGLGMGGGEWEEVIRMNKQNKENLLLKMNQEMVADFFPWQSPWHKSEVTITKTTPAVIPVRWVNEQETPLKPGCVYVCLQVFTVSTQAKPLFCNDVTDVTSLVAPTRW